MSWQLVAWSDTRPQPWRNGGGATRELLAWPSAGRWHARISVADIATDGPFSTFAGVERWFAVLEGEGVRLRIAGQARSLSPGDAPLRFDGDAEVHCALVGGRTRDLNLMTLGSGGAMRRLRGRHRLECLPPRLVALYSQASPARLAWGPEQVAVPPATLAWRVLEAPGAVEVQVADALWMEAQP